ncbi:putative defense protein 3 [Amphiura filiformis]|uniref:putative defense protein 3 n=1 Tax=Amphiura filiformis TaxID=82378 RepID=UPI003B2238ED
MMLSSAMPLLGLLICVVLPTATDAYPSGPPSSACTSLQPTGHNSSPQTVNSPYQITLDSDTYSPGQTVRVTLSGVSDTAFAGFIVQARRKDEFKDTTTSVGSFSSPPTGTKLMACHNNQVGTWTHSSNADKTTVTIEWTAPGTFEGDMAFRATVVQGPAQTYWENVLSTIITYDGPTIIPTTEKETGGQSTIQPIYLLLATATGLLSVLFLWQRLH